MSSSAPPSASSPTPRFVVAIAVGAVTAIVIGTYFLSRACNEYAEKSSTFRELRQSVESNEKIKEIVGTPITLRVENFCSESGFNSELTEYSAWAQGPKQGRSVTGVVRREGANVRVIFLELRGEGWLWEHGQGLVLLTTDDRARPDCSD